MPKSRATNNLPQLLFKGSNVYLDILYHPRDLGREVNSLNAYRNRFVKKYQKYFPKILRLIPVFSGYLWGKYSDPIIPVYFVHHRPSFSSPLTLNAWRDSCLTLGILIHELAHNNMCFRLRDEERKEKAMNFVTIKVMEKLKISTRSYQTHSQTIYRKRFKCQYQCSELGTVKKYLTPIAES